MRLIIAVVLAMALSGCSSLQLSGVSEYTVRPFKIGEETLCCEVAVRSGREVSHLAAHVQKKWSDYSVDFVVQGVTAFEGQAGSVIKESIRAIP